MEVSTGLDRREIFAAKLTEIIAHNRDPAFHWKKGLNAYSDMTDEEFMQYFHIVNDP